MGKLGLFKAVPITFITVYNIILFDFWSQKNYKSNMYCMFFSFS